MNGRTIVAFALLMLLFGGMQRTEAGVIDISGGDLSACCWGGSGFVSYGQVFTATAGDSILVDYSFTLETLNAQFAFVSQVYAWNGSGVTGPALFTSGVFLSPLPLDDFATYVFSPSIAITSGQQYLALVTNQPGGVSLGAPADSGGSMFLKQGNPYAGGQFVFTGGNPETAPWFLTLRDADAVFHADLAPVPEPGYACRGFAAPFEESLSLKGHAQRVIPLTMQLVNDGLPITDLTIAGGPPVVKIKFSAANGGTPVDVTDEVVPVGHSSPDGAFGFDPTTGLWSLHLGTGPFTAPGTYRVTVASGDATYSIDPTCHGEFVRLP